MTYEIKHALNLLNRTLKQNRSNEIVDKESASKILTRLFKLLNNSNVDKERLETGFHAIFEKVRKGINYITFITSLQNIILQSQMNVHEYKTEMNGLSKLENEIRDIRHTLNAKNELGNRLEKLQEQVEILIDKKPQTEQNEPNDNLLQKFLSSDKKAFIIMPFDKEFDNVWLGAMKPACTDAKYVPLRLDELSLSSLITDDIEKYSNMADVVLVDLTDNNPNVMFEFGWTLAKNKKPIVICQGAHSNKVAFDTRGIRHIQYENTWLGIEELKKKILNYINTTESSSKKVTKKKGTSKKQTIKSRMKK